MWGYPADCSHYEENKEKYTKKKMSAKLKRAVEEESMPDMQPEVTLRPLMEPDVFDEPDERSVAQAPLYPFPLSPLCS